jgi:hypothetical protein
MEARSAPERIEYLLAEARRKALVADPVIGRQPRCGM